MSAIFSPCRTWRYRLDRIIDPRLMLKPPIGFLLHNSSTAAEAQEDATSRRGINFVTAWGGGRLVFLNPWAFVATKPADLWRAPDPAGPQNDAYIEQAALEIAMLGGFIVCAWGDPKAPSARREEVNARLRHVLDIIRRANCGTTALALTKSGNPRHPLYLRADLKPFAWPA